MRNKRLIAFGHAQAVGKDLSASIVQFLLDSKRAGYSNTSIENFNSYIKNKHHLKSSYTNVKFADALKDIVCILLCCTREQLEDRDFKNKTLGVEWDIVTENSFQSELSGFFVSKLSIEQLNPRKIMQRVGTECMRNNLHQNTWVNALFSKLTDNSHWVVSDVRFPNEFEAIRQRGGILIKLERETGIIDNHASETALNGYEFDYVVDNNGTIADLVEKIKEILIKEGVI